MKFRRFTSILCLVLLLASASLLAGCGKGAAAQKSAEPTLPQPLHFAGGDVEPTAEELKMPLSSGETALLASLPALHRADFSGSENEEEVAAWALSHPEVETRYTITLPDGNVLSHDARSADLSGMSAADCLAAARKLVYLPALESVNLGSEAGGLRWSDIAQIRALLPKPIFKYGFTLYGTSCDLSDTTISLFHVPVTDNGQLIDEVMGYMPQLSYVDMDGCGLEPKRLEEINLRHPGVKVVFRVFFGDNYTARTDVERILASMASRGGMLTDSNVDGLYYCHDVKYLDLGHNTWLTNIGFCAQMPKLEVAILSMCNIRDLSPLASCPELEYLELSNTYADDLRPLAGLGKLRHLNVASIGYDFYGDGARPSLTDISPLYSLTGLERLWIGAYNPVPAEQIQEMQRRAPNCEINTAVYEDPVGGRWRYVELANYVDTYVDKLHPRYEKLREQFGNYDYSVYNFTWNDPLYDPNYAAASAAPAPTPAPAAPEPVYQEQYWEPEVYEPYYVQEPVYDPYYQEAESDWPASQESQSSGEGQQTAQDESQASAQDESQSPSQDESQSSAQATPPESVTEAEVFSLEGLL